MTKKLRKLPVMESLEKIYEGKESASWEIEDMLDGLNDSMVV